MKCCSFLTVSPSGQSASVCPYDLSCSTCCNSCCEYLCTEVLSFHCTLHCIISSPDYAPQQMCFPTYTAGLERRGILRRWSLKINLLSKLYYRYQRCTHTHTLDKASILLWKIGTKIQFGLNCNVFFPAEVSFGLWSISGVLGLGSRKLCASWPTKQPGGSRWVRNQVHAFFFHLNLFMPLFKHKSILCQPLMDYVEGGLCFQHLLIDLASSHPAW